VQPDTGYAREAELNLSGKILSEGCQTVVFCCYAAACVLAMGHSVIILNVFCEHSWLRRLHACVVYALSDDFALWASAWVERL